jgi:CRP-like cAMP-binding protein
MTIQQILCNIYPLPADSLAQLESIAEQKSYPKGHLLLRAGRTEDQVYFIKQGIARAFSEKRDRNVTFWFGQEGDAVVSMRSYVEQKPGYEHIELLEDCELYQMEAAKLQALYRQDINIANWGRKFAEKEIIKTENRLIKLQIGSASERYKEFMEENPALLQRVPLGHIASYLGISAVSLSRIRAEKG